MGTVLNIARLGADAPDYYLDGVAADEVDYYTGRGEAPGRWLGSLPPELGLPPRVERPHFERLLAGLHPLTGDTLVSAAGSNARARLQAPTEPGRRRSGADALDAAQVAAQLKVSTRAVQHWLSSGTQVWDAVQAATPDRDLATPGEVHARLAELAAAGDRPDLPSTFLLAQRVPARPGHGGHKRFRWAITQAEVDRVRSTRRPPSARAGWDLVFRPLKSYSVLWAVGGTRLGGAIHQIHHEAVDAALAYLEDAAARARTTATVDGQRGRVRTTSGGFVVAGFDHRDSRAGDPLLHTHCVLINATRLADGRWVALDPGATYRHGLAADAVYQATFRHLAERRLGLVSEPVVNGWADVAGVPRSVIGAFSKRSEEIAAELERVGSDSARARQIAAVATRRAKSRHRDAPTLHDRWRREAAALGFDDTAVAACLGRTTGTSVDPARIERLFDRLAGPDGLTQTAASFGRADVVCALATALGGAASGTELARLADRFLASHRVVGLREHRPGQPRARLYDHTSGGFVDDLDAAPFTVPELAAIERRLMDAADRAPGAQPLAPPGLVEEAITARPRLSGEQATMVRAVCGPGGILRAVVGYPGAGKTTATEACVAALRAGEVPVIGCAVTAEAADELARASGLGARCCDTIARTLLDLDHPVYGGLRPGTVVIVDEASTVSHRDLARLLAHVEQAAGTLVLIGDPHQHGAVGPGHFFGWLVETRRAEIAALRANLRQVDVVDESGAAITSLAVERQAIVAWREGRVVEALAQRDAAGLVTRAATAPQLYDRLTDDWFADWQTGRRDPMITNRNSVRTQLNQRARRRLIDCGALGGPELVVAGRSFQPGDYVIARRNNRLLRGPQDHDFWVRNGSRGTVAAVHPASGHLDVNFDTRDGPCRVRLPARYLTAGHLEHAYAVTDYAVQGRTLGRARVLFDDTTTAAGAYVSTTRGRLENRVYIVDGTVAEARDHPTSHGPPPTRESSFDTLAARLEADRPDALLHEIDPRLTEASTLAAHHSLAQLHAALAPIAAALGAAPPDVTRRIAGAETVAERLLTRRRLLEDRLTATERPTAARRDRASHHLADSLRADIAQLDGALERLTGRLTALRAQAARREAFLADHADDTARAALLREAIAARQAKVRLAATPIGTTSTPVGRDRGAHGARDRRAAQRDAAEHVAVYRDRWAPATTGEPTTALGLLGPRPTRDTDAASDWDAAASALAKADRLTASPAAGGDPVPTPGP